jgi:hypothetical protein
MSVNEMATQNVWQHHFPEPCGERVVLWDKSQKMMVSSLPPVTPIWVILSDVFAHVTLKRI